MVTKLVFVCLLFNPHVKRESEGSFFILFSYNFSAGVVEERLIMDDAKEYEK